MKLVPLTQGLFAKVDDTDYERVFNFSPWFACKKRGAYYAACRDPLKGRGSLLYMHTLITGEKWVDHRDRDGLNNQSQNLRKASRSQNGANRVKNGGSSSSTYKGVSLTDNGKWRAVIYKDKKRFELGRFNSEREAVVAYNKSALSFFGEFALLNKVPEILC